MAGEEWAQTSIVVLDSNGEAIETVEVPGATLNEQLDRAEVWLTKHGPAFTEGRIDERRVRLYVSWTPAEGRHAMTLQSSLISALANVGGVFWMDAYGNDD